MTEDEIVGIVIASIFGAIVLILGIWYLVIVLKDTFEHFPRKKSKEQRIEELENKVKVLEFKVENPNGLQLRLVAFWCAWELDYISCDTVKTISLPSATEYKFVRGFIVDNKGNKYKFDIDNEILIKIEKK